MKIYIFTRFCFRLILIFLFLYSIWQMPILKVSGAHSNRRIVEGAVQISGKIVSVGGEQIKGAIIIIDNLFSATTDDSGQYEIKIPHLDNVFGLPSGDHVFIVTANGYRTKIIRQTALTLNEHFKNDVTPGCPGNCANINVTLQTALGQLGISPTGTNLIDAVDRTIGPVVDEDKDGIDDVIEDWLALRFAPLVYHGEKERQFPTSVDWFLQRSSLHQFDDNPNPDFDVVVSKGLSNQKQLLGQCFQGSCQDAQSIRSDATRSRCKQLTYYLADLGAGDQSGEPDNPQDWITYVHSYGNIDGGVTIQYWRFYAQDYAYKYRTQIEIRIGPIKIKKDVTPGHGGDWEGIAVHLGADLRPKTVGFLGHTGINRVSANNVQWAFNGDHPKVWSEEGGHSSQSDQVGLESSKFIEHQTWNGGKVTWWDGTDKGLSGGLVNIGEKSNPRNNQVFVQYSGLWGSPGLFFVTSGYWGPAYNETGALCADEKRRAYESDHVDCPPEPPSCGNIFHTAWCDGMAGTLLDKSIECYTNKTSR